MTSTLPAFADEMERSGPMTRLSAAGLSLGYDGENIVTNLDLTVLDRKITAIVGANACGKSTLLRGLARLLKLRNGAVYLDGSKLAQLSTLDVAKVLGLLPQAPVAPDGITVADLVSRGRYPHQGWFRRWTEADHEAVTQALAATGTVDLINRPLRELSGGQRQRVWVAMALAQDTDLLLLDEPTTYLDINHQVELLRLLRALNTDSGKTIVAVLHDLNLASRFCDHIVAMAGGAIVAEGAPAEVITAELVERVFGLSCKILTDPVAGTPIVVPV